MHTFLALAAVVVVAVSGKPHFLHTDGYRGDDSGVSLWTFQRPSRGPRPVPAYDSGVLLYGGGDGGLMVEPGDGDDSSYEATSEEGQNEDDVDQDYSSTFSQRPLPWYFPGLPWYPTRPEGFPMVGDVDFDDFFGSRPVKGRPFPNPWYSFRPYLPKQPDIDELPDNYENSTHQIHDVDGKRVEVNTTTDKKTDGSFTSFVHTEVIHVLPGVGDEEQITTETPEEDTPITETPVIPEEEEPNSKETPEEHTPKETPSDQEITTVQPTQEPPVDVESDNELPTFNHVVPAELVRGKHHTRGGDHIHSVPAMDRSTRGNRAATKPEKQLSAPYKTLHGASKIKEARKEVGKGPGKGEGQLSGDTLVNKKGRKSEEPDAEKINDELL